MLKDVNKPNRHDVVAALARKRKAPIAQIARDFGVSVATLHCWLKRADVDEGIRDSVTFSEQKELRKARNRIKLLEQ